MRRRDFVAGIAGTATWSVLAHAQQASRSKRIAVLMPYLESDPVANAWLGALLQRLSELGWTDGASLKIETRWTASEPERIERFSKELIELQPDLLFTDSTPQTAVFQHETHSTPIVFVMVSDPVGSGFVASLAHPGGNITGFTHQEASIAGKWLQLLKEIIPAFRRVAIMFNPETAPYVRSYYLPLIPTVAKSLDVETIVGAVRTESEADALITSLGHEPGSGLIVMPDIFTSTHRAAIIASAARNKVPAVYQTSAFAKDGGLLSFGADQRDIYYRAGSYVDRILKGEKPADLPVQAPTRYETVLNLKAANALGVAFPEALLATANEVIE
jgi:ABC-type uncharacterized transport system substrate-binding protein